MLQCVDGQVETAHLVQHYHVERRRGRALIHVAAHMEAGFIRAPMNHRVNEPAIVVEGEDDMCVFGEELVEGHVFHPMRMIVRHHQSGQVHHIDNSHLDARNILLQKYVPGIKVRVVNVVDLTALMMPDDHPHGMENMSFNELFTKDAHVIFAFHNNRWLIHTMVHGRSNEARFHVRGYMDQGTTTTPFDMVVLNKMSRFHLAIDALKHVSRLRSQVSDVVDMFNRKLYEHHDYIRQHLEDMPEIRNWRWTADFSEPTAPPPLAKGHPRGSVFSDS